MNVLWNTSYYSNSKVLIVQMAALLLALVHVREASRSTHVSVNRLGHFNKVQHISQDWHFVLFNINQLISRFYN